MLAKHLTDDEVQLYVEDMTQCDMNIVEHVHVCNECKMKIDIYRVVITGIKQQPSPSFDFDVSELVLQKLPSPKPKATDKLLLWTLIFIGIAFVGVIVYYFKGSFSYLFEGISSIFIYLLVITVVTVLTGLFIDMYKKYNKEMRVLDSF